MKPPRLVIISGLSGSGKSTAARALEDEGFFVVDNLPVPLLPGLLEFSQGSRGGMEDLAIVIDVRTKDFLDECEAALEGVRRLGYRLDILFFEASDEILLRRYSETRRRHPLDEQGSVAAGIEQERQLLAGLRSQATVISDTSVLTPHQLRSRVLEMVRLDGPASPLSVLVQSFGFRHGIPPASDLVMDIRFLSNPHFVPGLRNQTGIDAGVRDYVLTQPACREFLQRFRDLLDFLLPHYRQEGKSYLTISVGCTGGRHRSVAVTEALAPLLSEAGMMIKVFHRDIDRGR